MQDHSRGMINSQRLQILILSRSSLISLSLLLLRFYLLSIMQVPITGAPLRYWRKGRMSCTLAGMWVTCIVGGWKIWTRGIIRSKGVPPRIWLWDTLRPMCVLYLCSWSVFAHKHLDSLVQEWVTTYPISLFRSSLLLTTLVLYPLMFRVTLLLT